MKTPRRVLIVLVSLGLLLSALPGQTLAADPVRRQAADTFKSTGDIGSLREEAEKAGILIGSGMIKGSDFTSDGRPPNYLTDPRFADVLADQFGSLSPENDLKWMFVQPEEGVFDFTGLDRLVAFAKKHDMAVKGHGLISSCCNPDYLLAKTDPVEFRAAMVSHFNAIMHRYKGKMDRWDVVSEALSTFGGTGLQANAFYNVLGPDYVAEAFRIAHAADPHARLFINENLVEYYPQKRQELYDLVSGLIDDGVPIDGVALQMHMTIAGPQPGALTEIVNSYTALGLEVTIAEMDVHSYDPVSQAQIYGDVLAEALDAGITDISFWGFSDAHLYTWLPGAKPNLFDEDYNPKPAYFAVRDELRNFVSDTPVPTTAPGVGTISVTGGPGQGPNKGNYTIVMKLTLGTPGSFYRLFENDTLVAVRGLDGSEAVPQTVGTSFTGKPAGTYTYRGELINARGTTSTTTVTVTVLP
jgi:endo-1,4-beta-xylanase